MALVGPAPISFNPLRRLAGDLVAERRTTVPFPPGETWFSLRRTRGFALYPLRVLLDGYERFGPVFTMRVFHGNSVFMIGPEANHYMTVSHASNFSWREGHMGDLTPLLGDGLLTIDGEFHHRSRRIMVPAFHHTTIATALGTMNTEIDRALEGWRDGLEDRHLPLDAAPGAPNRDACAVRLRPRHRRRADRHGAQVRAGPRLLVARLLAAGDARAGQPVRADAEGAARARPA